MTATECETRIVMTGDQKTRTAIVLGAGMVGISCAIHLRKRGWQVTLLEKTKPGAETSYGNAGVLSRGSVLPISYPGMVFDVPKILTGGTNAVRFDLSGLARAFSWAPSFLRNGTKARNRKISIGLSALVAHCVQEHEVLMEEAGATSHLAKRGWIKTYRTEASFQKTAFEREMLDKYGVRYAVLEPEDLAKLEPNLAPIYAKGLHILDTASVDDPGALCAAYADLFKKLGGAIEIGAATSIGEDKNGATVQLADGRALFADHAVVALGPWSAGLLKTAGVTLPAFEERGYHRHYRAEGNATLNRPINDVDGAFVIAPMAAGIRLTCGVEIAAFDHPKTPKQLEAVLPKAREAFPLGDTTEDEPWLGRRPSLPDSLPAIGKAPRHDRVWTCFGHHHIGLTTGPISGRLLAEMMSGEETIIDPKPYNPARFD